MKVTKRNGEVVDFNSEKIGTAIAKAYYAIHSNHHDDWNKMSMDEQYALSHKVMDHFDKDQKEFKIEELQNAVETTLMEEKLFDVAKAYILYRAERAKLRAEMKNSTDDLVLKRLASESSEAFNHEVMREFIYMRTYSRWIPEFNRREMWTETVDRYIDFLRENLGDKLSSQNYNDIKMAIFKQEVMPSLRLLQFAGPPARRCNVCAYNCAFTAPQCFKDLVDIMYLSMSGTGVGFSVEAINVAMFPKITKIDHECVYPWEIVDSKEGWCDAFHTGLRNWVNGADINFDYSKLRPAGARLKTMGGRSSGPKPLMDLMQFTREIFRKRMKSGHKLTTLDIHDIICKIGQIVVAGGVRRCIAEGSKVPTREDLSLSSKSQSKNIEDIEIGDYVLTQDGYTDGWKPVIEKVYQGKQQVLQIHHQQGILECTPNHRVAVFKDVNSKPIWKEASELTTEDYLGFPRFIIGFSDSFVLVNITKILTLDEFKDTYDIEVKDNHNFVCSGVLVHNSALLSLSDFSDHEMRDCKTGQFWNTNSQRSLANNSAIYDEKPSQIEFMKEWLALAESGTGERGIFNRGGLNKVMPQRRINILGDRITKMGSNPCITIDTPIMTPKGYKPVSELIGQRQNLLVEGVVWQTTDQGFWKSGTELVYELKVKRNGFKTIKCTAAHQVFKLIPNEGSDFDQPSRMEWTQVADLKKGDYIVHSDHTPQSERWAEYEIFASVESIISLDVQDVYDCTIDSNEIHWYDSNGILSHNCGEILLQPFQFCNLTEVVCRSDDTRVSLLEKIRIATIIGTCQASLSDFKYIDRKWKKNQDEERLLGVSLTGIYDCPILQTKGLLSELRGHSNDVNVVYSKYIGINPSTAITTVKPSGSVSQMVNSSSGIHPRFAQYYIRRVRISATDPLLQLMINQGYECSPEVGQVEPNVNTYVLDFAVKSPDNTITADEIPSLQQLETWKRFKIGYTEHNPSVTIYIKPDEWLKTGLWVWENWNIITGLSFLPYSDHIYELAPYEAITKEQYEKMQAGLKRVDFSKLKYYEKEDTTDVKKELACVGGACEL